MITTSRLESSALMVTRRIVILDAKTALTVLCTATVLILYDYNSTQ